MYRAEEILTHLLQSDSDSDADDGASLDETSFNNVEIEEFSEDEIELDDAVIESALKRSDTFTIDKIFYNKAKDFKWNTEPTTNQSFLPTWFPPTLSSRTNTCQSGSDYFSLIFNHEIIDKIRSYTNQRINVEDHTSALELNAFFGLLIMFGVTKKNLIDVNELWSYDSIHHIDYANACMPRERFKFLCSKIVFDQESSRISRAHDKIGKIRELLDLFQRNIELMTPGENLCVDEQLYSFRGRCGFKQYMQSKPAKYGIKYWALVDVQSSYVLNTKLYLGKINKNDKQATNVGENIVVNLAQTYFNKQTRTLTADNFFSSIKLAQLLYSKNILFIGTLRKNKPEIPVEFYANRNKQINSFMFGFNNELSIVSYVPKKNKAVLLLSTLHNNKEIEEDSQKPISILFYNQTKGGVDTVDHLIENFTCRRKTNRWTFNVLMYLLDLAAHNSFCLFKLKNKTSILTNEKRLRRMQLESLALDLMKPFIFKRAQDISLKNTGIKLSLIESFKRIGQPIEKKVEIKAKTDTKRQRCAICVGNDSKYSKTCSTCHNTVCNKHCKVLNTVYCDKCFEM